MIEVAATPLAGVLKIQPPPAFEDFRGEFLETYNEREYRAAGIEVSFVQDDISVSRQHVLRGIHGDYRTYKLAQCLLGAVYMVVVNWLQDSPQKGRWEAFTLTDRNRTQVLVPPGYGVGHLVLSEQAIFSYKQSTYYDRASQFTLMWDDPDLAVWWPIRNPILSKRDQGIE